MKEGVDALLTRQQAAALLGVQEGELDAAIAEGHVREVWHRAAPEAPLASYVLAADVGRAKIEKPEKPAADPLLQLLTAVLDGRYVAPVKKIIEDLLNESETNK